MSPKAFLALSVVGLLLVTNAFTAWKSYDLGRLVERAVHDKAEKAATESKITTREKQNEIRNHRPDLLRHAQRMRDGSF